MDESILKLKGDENKIKKIIEIFNAEKNDEFFLKNNRIGRIFVPATGNVDAKIALIGEAPGRDEEKLREPFVGKAGMNLNYVLEKVGLNRNELYITNIFKFRPFDNEGKNRKPNAKESSRGLFYLKKELKVINPRLIVCLGATAASTLLGKSISMRCSVNQLFSLDSFKVLITYHPSPFNFNRKELQQSIIESFQLIKEIINQI